MLRHALRKITRATGRRGRVRAGLAVAVAAGLVLAVAPPASAWVDYTLTSRYVPPSGQTLSSVKGWTIEWKVPQTTNQSTGQGVIGQWFDNLESGVYLYGGAWHLYFYDDGNGVNGSDPALGCQPTWEKNGQNVGGWCRVVQPNTQLVFKYEWCTTSNQPSVTGTQRCVWVDLKDGAGYRFLSQDGGRPEGPEMYAHEMEIFGEPGTPGAANNPVIPCTSPVRMVRQTRKTSTGSWVTMTGSSTWAFHDTPANAYTFQNRQLSSNPASWEACSG